MHGSMERFSFQIMTCSATSFVPERYRLRNSLPQSYTEDGEALGLLKMSVCVGIVMVCSTNALRLLSVQELSISFTPWWWWKWQIRRSLFYHAAAILADSCWALIFIYVQHSLVYALTRHGQRLRLHPPKQEQLGLWISDSQSSQSSFMTWTHKGIANMHNRHIQNCTETVHIVIHLSR